MTIANGINSGGICLIFCHVGRNLSCQSLMIKTKEKASRGSIDITWSSKYQLIFENEAIKGVRRTYLNCMIVVRRLP